ncbi:hypothetical protein Sste5344_005912 [Sporothrix stenoceras]
MPLKNLFKKPRNTNVGERGRGTSPAPLLQRRDLGDSTKESSSGQPERYVAACPPVTDAQKTPASATVEVQDPRSPVTQETSETSLSTAQTQVLPVQPTTDTRTCEAETEPGAKVPPAVANSVQKTALSISQRLWNDAYDSLKNDKDTVEIVEAYTITLTKVVRAEASASGATDKLAQLDDPETRQRYMNKLVQEGQTRISKASKITKKVGDFAAFVLSAKGLGDLIVQNFPPAALPWAGVCAGLQILMNPANATKSNLAGIAHVVSQMDWYCALTEHLLDGDKTMIGNESFKSVMQQLEKAVVTLYKALLLYQMKSVRSYHRNLGLVILRGLANMDDWDGDLSGVTDAEATIKRLSVQYHQEYEKSCLYQLVVQGKEARTLLGDIRKDIRELIAQQQTIQEKSENRECLRALFAVDPQSDMGTIESKKGDLLYDAYKWILNSKEYAAFTNWSEGASDVSPCRLLWIKGPAGTGKTMLVIGIIRELSRLASVLSPGLSYFFYQGTGDKALRSATAALRSLIWLLLYQQPLLIFHLRSKYENIGTSLFHDRNTFVALSNVFKSMLKDPQLQPTYFVVDALDECDQELDEFVKLISSSIALSDKVKWLVSSRPEVKVEIPDTAEGLVELDAQKLKDPVNAYIDHKLSTLRALPGYDEDTLAEVTDEIHRRAENTFLWVAIVLKELHSVEGWYAIDIIRAMPRGLSDLMSEGVLAVEKLKNLLTLEGHNDKVTSVAFSADGNYIASASDDMTVKIWDTTSGACSQTLEGHNGPVTSVVFSVDGNYIASASHDKTVKIWDTTSGVCRQTLEGHIDWVRSVAFSADGNYVASASDDMTVKIWDTTSGACRQTLEGHNDWVRSVDFSADGNYIASASEDMTIKIWDTTSGACRQTLEGHNRWVTSVAFSVDGNYVASASGDNTVKIWDTTSGACRQTLEGHNRWVTSVAFSADGNYVASASEDMTIKIWDTTSGACRQTLEGHNDWVTSVAFSVDGNYIASASSDNTVKIWDTTSGAYRQTLEGHNGKVTSVAFSADGNYIASVSDDMTMKIWDTTSGVCRQTLEGHNGPVTSVDFSVDGNYVASASEDMTIKIWDTTSGACRQTLEGHNRWVTSVAFSVDGNYIASAPSNNTVKIWDTTSGVCRQTLEGHNDWVRSVAFSADGNYVASASDDMTVKIWDTTSGACRQTLEGHNRWVTSVAFSVDGNYVASASGDNTVKIWDTTHFVFL